MTSQQVRGGGDSEQDDDDSGCAGFSNSSSDDGADSKQSSETSDVGQLYYYHYCYSSFARTGLFSQPDEGGRRGHDQKLFKKRFRLDVKKKFFYSNRVIDNWNMLPASCVNSSALLTLSRLETPLV